MDRQDLIQLLTDAMQGRLDEGVLGGRLREGQVKSRLVEAHPPEASNDGSHSLLTSVAEAAGLDLQPLSDDLWMLLGADDAFFVDALNPRFWLLHSTAPAHTVKSLWRQYVVSSAKLDSAWLTAEQLREVEGERRWIKSSFSSDELQPHEPGAAVPRRWRVQVEGDSPDELLDIVGQHPKYRASASLTAVATILRDDQLGTAQVAADYQGGFVSSGSSFEVVIGLLWRSLDRYESYVRDLESRFQLKTGAVEEASDDVGVALTFEGDVAQLDFPHRVSDLETFVGNLFNSREPFRLWAVPREVGQSQWEANAVDLHVGHTLRLEITPDWMRIMLGEHTCGNTLARLLANFQHRFDAQTRLEPALG